MYGFPRQSPSPKASVRLRSDFDDSFTYKLHPRWVTQNVNASDYTFTSGGFLWGVADAMSTRRKLLQALPDGDCVLETCLHIPHGTSIGCGLMVASSTNPATCYMAGPLLYGNQSNELYGNQSNDSYFFCQHWSNGGDTYHGAQWTYTAPRCVTYLRVQRIGSAYTALWSIDGLVWTSRPFTVTQSITAAGFFWFAYDGDATQWMQIRYFRYTTP